MAVLQAIDAEPERWDLSRLQRLIVGGSAVPRSMLEGFDRHELTIIQAWGMTETSPLGSVARLPVELTTSPWFQTGDVVKIETRGCIRICDRSKDLVKSGAEWISSVDLENLLMAHPAVAEAAVIAVPDGRWGERPLAAVVLRDGHQVSAEELREHLSKDFAKWQLPERMEFIDEIPRTATGKFKKTELRGQFVKAAVGSRPSGQATVTAPVAQPSGTPSRS